MVKAAERMNRANRATATISEQTIAPALAPGTLEVRESERVRRQLEQEREKPYEAGVQEPGTKGSRKRYAWEV